MNWQKLISYQLILLVTLYRGCQSYTKIMAIREVRVSATMSGNFVFGTETLSKRYPTIDRYDFILNDELVTLIGGKFTSEEIEITHALDTALEFLLMRPNQDFLIYCQFLSNMDLQIFFSDLRKPLPLQNRNGLSVRKSFQFSVIDNTVSEMANDSFLYRKVIPQNRKVGAVRSYNLVRLYAKSSTSTGTEMLVQEVDLVFLPQTFNITALIGADKFGLCLQRAPDVVFILRLRDREQAMLFFSTLTRDANPDIPCVLEYDWLRDNIQYIDSPQPFDLPHLPYLKRDLV